jgi:hypothetical protein
MPGGYWPNQPTSQRSSTESELLKLAQELKKSREEADLRSREHDIQSREHKQQILELMHVVQGLQEDRKHSDIHTGSAQSKGTVVDTKSKTEGETNSKVALTAIKVPIFTPLEGLFRAKAYCRAMLDFQLQNSQLSHQQAVGFIVATFKSSSSAFTYWVRWRPALLALTVPEAHAAIMAVSSGHTLADQVSLYATAGTASNGPLSLTDNPTMSTAARVSQLMGDKDPAIADIVDPKGRLYPVIPAFCIVVEKTLGSKAIAGEVALVLSLKMGSSNSMHPDVTNTETPAQFCLRCCETRQAFDVTQLVVDFTIPSLLQLFINGLPQSLKEVYHTQRLTLNLGSKTVEERLAAVAAICENAWVTMHQDKIAATENELRRIGNAREPRNANSSSTNNHGGGTQQPNSKSSDSRYRPASRGFQTFTTIATDGEKKKETADSVTLTTVSKQEQPMPPTGPPSEVSAKYSSSAHYGIKPRNGNRPSPLAPSGGRGGRDQPPSHGSGGRGSFSRPREDRDRPRDRSQEPGRFRSLDQNNPPRNPNRYVSSCSFCGADNHTEPECEHKKQAKANLALGMRNVHNSHSHTGSSTGPKRISWDPATTPGNSNLKPSDGSWRQRPQQSVTAATVSQDDEDLYWSTNNHTLMTVVTSDDTAEDRASGSHQTVSDSIIIEPYDEHLYLPVTAQIRAWEIALYEDEYFYIDLEMIKPLICGLKAQASRYKLQDAIAQGLHFVHCDSDDEGIEFSHFQSIMDLIDSRVANYWPRLRTQNLRTFDVLVYLRTAAKIIDEIARQRMLELFAIGSAYDLGGESSASTSSSFWLERPDWVLSWKAISSKAILKDIYTRKSLLYHVAITKDVWEPSIPATEDDDPQVYEEDVSALNVVFNGEKNLLKEEASYTDSESTLFISEYQQEEDEYDSYYPTGCDSDSYRDDIGRSCAHWSQRGSLSFSKCSQTKLARAKLEKLASANRHASRLDKQFANNQAGASLHEDPGLFSFMSHIEEEPSDTSSIEESDDDFEEDERTQLAPAISHWFGPFTDFDVRTAIGVGFLTSVISSLRDCVRELDLEEGTRKDFDRLEHLVVSKGTAIPPANRLVIRPEDWRFEDKCSLTYIWSRLKAASELHLKELADGKLTPYMQERGDSIFFSHGLSHGSALDKLMRLYPWRSPRLSKDQQYLPPKARINLFIKQLVSHEEVSGLDVLRHAESIFTSTYLLRKKTERRALHVLLAAFLSQSERMVEASQVGPSSFTNSISKASLLDAIQENIRGIFFWVEGNTVRKGDTQIEPWTWSPQCANYLCATLKAFKHLENQTDPEACLATFLSQEPSPLQGKASPPLSLTSAKSIISMKGTVATVKEVEDAVYWLWNAYHLLGLDCLICDPIFPRVLDCLVKADTGRDWTVRPGVFKDLLKDIIFEIIDKEDKSICLELTGLPLDDTLLSFNTCTWPGYDDLVEALQLIEIAADTRLSDLLDNNDSGFWSMMPGSSSFRAELLCNLDGEDIPPGYGSLKLTEVTERTEIELILPFLSTFSDHCKCPMIQSRASILQWDEPSKEHQSSPASDPVVCTLADDTTGRSLMNQHELNQQLMEDFKEANPFYYNHKAYLYVCARLNSLSRGRTADDKALAVKYLPYFQALVPDFNKYFAIFRNPGRKPHEILWDDNSNLAWTTIMQLFKNALAGADGLVIVEELWPQRMNRSARRLPGRLPQQMATFEDWKSEYWPLSCTLEEGSYEKPATFPQLKEALSKLSRHQTVLGFGPWTQLPSSKFQILSEPLFELLNQAEQEHAWEPVQVTAFKYLLSQIRDVLWTDEVAEAREEASLISFATRHQPPTPSPFQTASHNEVSTLTSLLTYNDIDTDDDDWGYSSDQADRMESDYFCFTSFTHAAANYKEARRYPQSYAPTSPTAAGTGTNTTKRPLEPDSSPRPLSFSTHPAAVPPSEEVYQEEKARRARLRYLAQPASDATKCLGIVVNGIVHTQGFRALLDDASNAFLITRELADRLGIPILRSSQRLTTMTEKGMGIDGETPLIELVYAPTSDQPHSVFHKFVVVDPKNSLLGLYDILIGNADQQDFRGTICSMTDTFTIRPDFKTLGRNSREIALPTRWERPFKQAQSRKAGASRS